MSLDPLAIQLIRVKAAADPQFRRALENRLRGQYEPPVERDILSVQTGATLDSILSEICMKHSVTKEAIKNRRHWPNLVRARQEFCWRARNETAESVAAIGRFMNRDHSTVIQSADKFAETRGLRKIRTRVRTING